MSTSENDVVVRALGALTQIAVDGLEGYRNAASRASHEPTRALLARLATRRAAVVGELEHALDAVAPPERAAPSPTRGTARGALHRGWVDLRHALEPSDAALIVECMRGEAAALKAYEHAIRRLSLDELPDLRALILQQVDAITTARFELEEARARLTEAAA